MALSRSQFIGTVRKYWMFFVPGLVVLGFIFFFFSRPVEEQFLTVEEENSTELSQWVEPKPFEGEPAQIVPEVEQGDEDKPLPILPPPPKASMERMKKEGCVADGFLSGYGDDENSSIALINRSNCYYLHRALETWLAAPDFEKAREIQAGVTKPNTVYGMFIAEAISTNEDYRFPAEQRDFDFGDMCRSGSKNFWGEHTCKPSLGTEEYRKYIRYITEEAMNMGIQSFLFGQVFYQDAADLSETHMPEVIEEMREYAAYRGMEIVIGAQTNDITDEKYLKLFDYIEGGVGLQFDGTVEDGPCFSRWYKKPGDWCWALLWNERYKSKANNVFVHFDWSGKLGDDMSVFTRMDQNEREAAVRTLHKKFTSDDVGFLMPFLATLHRDNGGCSGPKKRFYSAHRKYSCQDEDALNKILEDGRE